VDGWQAVAKIAKISKTAKRTVRLSTADCTEEPDEFWG
jgi:hypothetical protein